jgi:hypothetical protein
MRVNRFETVFSSASRHNKSRGEDGMSVLKTIRELKELMHKGSLVLTKEGWERIKYKFDKKIWTTVEKMYEEGRFPRVAVEGSPDFDLSDPALNVVFLDEREGLPKASFSVKLSEVRSQKDLAKPK